MQPRFPPPSRCQVQCLRAHTVAQEPMVPALTAGIHPTVVQEMLGHSGISVTLDIHSHVPQDRGAAHGLRHHKVLPW